MMGEFQISNLPLIIIAIILISIGVLGMLIDTAWYLFVALALTGTPALDKLRNNAVIVNRITAAVLWSFAAAVLLAM